MHHDDGETTNAQGVPQAMASVLGTDSTSQEEPAVKTSIGESKVWRVYTDPGDGYSGFLFGVGAAAPSTGTLFGNIQTLPSDFQQEVSTLQGIVNPEAGQSRFSPDLYVMIPVAYWCQQVPPHVVFVEAVLLSDKNEPVCPDHHVVVEHLYTRKKLG